MGEGLAERLEQSPARVAQPHQNARGALALVKQAA